MGIFLSDSFCLFENMWKYSPDVKGDAMLHETLLKPIQHESYVRWDRKNGKKRKRPIAWKESKYGVFSGSYFPVFRLNTRKYGPVSSDSFFVIQQHFFFVSVLHYESI